jgi:hypothetical protein
LKLNRVLAGIVGSITALAILSATSAHAATDGKWGEWGSSIDDVNTGEILFYGDGIDATYTSVTTSQDNNILTTDSDEEYLDRFTPIAKAFKANSSSSDYNYFKAYVEPSGDNVITITFASAVAAGNLGIALSDIDSDQVTVSATTDGTTALTSPQVAGVSEANKNSLSFNFCKFRTNGPCNNDTDVVPVMFGQEEVQFGDMQDGDIWGTEGASAWIRPSVAVKTIRIRVQNGDADNSSSERIWIVQKSGSSLANTGTGTDAQLVFAGSLVLAGMLLATVSRRRRTGSERRHS